MTNYWKKISYIKFPQYTFLKKNRSDRQGVGVAITILINNSIQYNSISTISSETVEAIDVLLFPPELGLIEINALS